MFPHVSVPQRVTGYWHWEPSLPNKPGLHKGEDSDIFCESMVPFWGKGVLGKGPRVQTWAPVWV